MFELIPAFLTLFVVIDPVGLAPTFLGLTEGLAQTEKRRIGLEASIIAFLVLAGASLFGALLLKALDISLAAFRIAGGLLLFVIAFEMVFELRHHRKAEDAIPAPQAHLAAFPLAVPLLAGPGAIAACILLAGRIGGDPLGLGLLIGIIALILAISALIFGLSGSLARLMGPRGLIVMGRLLGVLLAALAVQYVADGIRTLQAH